MAEPAFDLITAKQVLGEVYTGLVDRLVIKGFGNVSDVESLVNKTMVLVGNRVGMPTRGTAAQFCEAVETHFCRLSESESPITPRVGGR